MTRPYPSYKGFKQALDMHPSVQKRLRESNYLRANCGNEKVSSLVTQLPWAQHPRTCERFTRSAAMLLVRTRPLGRGASLVRPDTPVPCLSRRSIAAPRRPRQVLSASSATSRPSLLRYLKASATLFSAL